MVMALTPGTGNSPGIEGWAGRIQGAQGKGCRLHRSPGIVLKGQTDSKLKASQVLWCTPVILAPGRLRQEDRHKPETSLGYKMTSCLKEKEKGKRGLRAPPGLASLWASHLDRGFSDRTSEHLCLGLGPAPIAQGIINYRNGVGPWF